MSIRYFLAITFSILSLTTTLRASSHQPWAPDFLIIGAQKSGTTQLMVLCSQHPSIQLASEEVHYFDRKFFKGLNWYKNKFPVRSKPHMLIGEKTPYYVFHPYVPERVHALYPHMKLILILRNPVDRAYSQYWHNRRLNTEPLTFEEAIDAEQSRLEGEVDKMKDPNYVCSKHQRYSYLARGIYVDQVKRWLAFFPREQLLILKQDVLRHNPQRVMNRIFKFLNLTPVKIKVKNPEKHSEYPPMNSSTRARLEEYYRPYNEQLEALLNMKFNWQSKAGTAESPPIQSD